MKELDKIYMSILEQFEIAQTKHEKFIESGNKSAEADVRKAFGEIKKLVTPYRQKSVEVTNKMKKKKK